MGTPELPPLAPVPRSAKQRPGPSRAITVRAFVVCQADGGTFRVVVNAATGAVLDRLLAHGDVIGGTSAILDAVGEARVAGVPITTTRVARTDGGGGYVALYSLADGTTLEAAGVHDG